MLASVGTTHNPQYSHKNLDTVVGVMTEGVMVHWWVDSSLSRDIEGTEASGPYRQWWLSHNISWDEWVIGVSPSSLHSWFLCTSSSLSVEVIGGKWRKHALVSCWQVRASRYNSDWGRWYKPSFVKVSQLAIVSDWRELGRWCKHSSKMLEKLKSRWSSDCGNAWVILVLSKEEKSKDCRLRRCRALGQWSKPSYPTPHASKVRSWRDCGRWRKSSLLRHEQLKLRRCNDWGKLSKLFLLRLQDFSSRDVRDGGRLSVQHFVVHFSFRKIESAYSQSLDGWRKMLQDKWRNFMWNWNGGEMRKLRREKAQ